MAEHVEMVRVTDLRVGDEVQGYGVLRRAEPESRATGSVMYVARTESHEFGDYWPAGAWVPVVRRPKKWRRTVVIDYEHPADVSTGVDLPWVTRLSGEDVYGLVVADTVEEFDG